MAHMRPRRGSGVLDLTMSKISSSKRLFGRLLGCYRGLNDGQRGLALGLVQGRFQG